MQSYTCIRSDYYSLAQRISGREGRISEKEFKASFPAGVELLGHEGAKPITVCKGKKSQGEPLVTLVPIHSPCINSATTREKPCSLTELRDCGVEMLATALTHGDFDFIPVRKQFSNGEFGPVVAYATRPSGLEMGVAA